MKALTYPKFQKHIKSIGLICASKREKNIVVSRFPRDHIFLIKSRMVPLALLAPSSQAQVVDKFVVRVYPKY